MIQAIAAHATAKDNQGIDWSLDMSALIHRSSLFALAALLWAGTATAQLGALPETPPDAKPGECYGLVYVPPQYRNTEESQRVAEATERSEVVPAVYEYVEEQVLIPAGKRRKVIRPAVTETSEETVTVPGGQRRVAVPATYRTISEQVTVSQDTVLKPGALFKGQEGGALCVVEQPTTQTRKKRVLDKPASSKLVRQPAREQVVKRRKVLEPAVTEWVAVPARTVTKRVKKLVTPASTRMVPVPAKYQTVARRELITPAKADWQRVLCETNFTPALVQSLQQALHREGVYKGPAHGRMNAQTAAGMRLYQERNALPTGGLGLATLAHLGVSLSDGQPMDSGSPPPAP
ncbi:MAG: peptidoglycan-binding domain-containing protein [Pseudomonadota bacterium]